jgi:transcriptional regulator with XRE-family HTH domain
MVYPPLKEMCRLARKQMKLSQCEFSKLIETTQPEISYIERGFIPEDPKKILKIKSFYKRMCEDGCQQ